MTGEVAVDESTCRKRLKSGRSTHYSFVTFVNNTFRKVDVIWLNYEGSCVRYRTLLPRETMNINTFAGHPWTFIDADTGDRLMVQQQEVYDPVPWKESDGWPPQRHRASITIPVFSLEICCLRRLQQLVPRNKVYQLDIAQHLKDLLTNRFKTKAYLTPPR